MGKIVFSLLLVSMLMPCFPVYGSQPARPYTGIGLLIIRPFSPADTPESSHVVLYEDPGIKRVTELNAVDIPRLFTDLNTSQNEYAIAVTGKKGEWLRIAYDDAGREGWVRMKRYWEYTTWHSFLKGRHVALLPQLRETDYMLRKECSDTSPVIADLTSRQVLHIAKVEGDWIRIDSGPSSSGCIRWRGNDGRIMISPDGMSLK
jgi:hypothetical protein